MHHPAVQSPINLLKSHALTVDDAEPLQYVGHWHDRGPGMLANDGRTAVLTVSGKPHDPFLVGGPLTGVYVFEQLHFHWGPDDAAGCEHLLEGRTHSMEAHLVHYNARYGSFMDARDQPDGLAVVAFLFQADSSAPDWDPLEPLVRALEHVHQPGTVTPIPQGCLRWLTSQDFKRHYYTYRGSLTTAPYSESVTWLVYRTPIYVSCRQTDAFRRLHRFSGNPSRTMAIGSNYRPIQTPTVSAGLVFVRNHSSNPANSKL
ncbi:carbonic anhydrase 7-like [Anopheles nili]|uniref:carbonic anhydrase 7-like n=1 Tax=Anopheles nili TaxID=185578 RepID=UPI00237C4DA0|nr:carbonic anhydrase 7-like [Anopheles nili]